VLQKFGSGLRNLDAAACAARKIKLLTLRRRANISCAEHAFGLMLMLARKLDELDGLVTIERIKAARGTFRPFQRAHTPGGNYARLGGTRALNGATIGIIGMGEIGREIAVRARAFDMKVLYHQRTRAPEAEERELSATHVPLPTLLAESDWIVPQLPTLPSTRDILGRAELSQIKTGACIVNVANAPLINRAALIEALKAGKLGGVALDTHYEEPVPDNDELLGFDNVIMTPRMAGSPRFNGLNDFEELITGLARELT
jgi:phosphoglycerate dehydrogenase-like enzyme